MSKDWQEVYKDVDGGDNAKDQEIKKVVEGLRKEPEQVQIPCPDGEFGCLVMHYEKKMTHDGTLYNQALDDVLKALTK